MSEAIKSSTKSSTESLTKSLTKSLIKSPITLEIFRITDYNWHMDRIIIAIGGGELREKQTAEIDRQISGLVKKRCEGRRPTALFVGTASHDSMPYYNSFHKTYTGLFGLKTDCALTVYGEMNYEKIEGKFLKADVIYVGGGDTLFMLDGWEKSGVKKLILDAYERGVVICGLSAGAICWFDEMFTDSAGADYEFKSALGVLKGGACPHFDKRKADFENKISDATVDEFICVEDLSAVMFVNGVLKCASDSTGNSYIANVKNAEISYKLIGKSDFSQS